MVTTKRRITTGLIATGLGASMAFVPLAASATTGAPPPVKHAPPAGFVLAAHMHATHKAPHADGFALYKVDFGKRPMGGPAATTAPQHQQWGHHVKKEFFIKIWGIKALHGKTLVVRADGKFIGKMTVSKHGKAELSRHSHLPWLRSGDVVRVRTKSGKLVSYGTLYKKHMHHDHVATR
jgi:hypothetical protein